MLKIDPEFQNKIPPLTEAEFEQLEENIVSDGEVYEPIATWNGIIVDGHNRWKIVQKHSEIPYKIREMDFPDKWAAFEWMYKKQLGRRNLTDEQKTYMIGKMYEARKNTSSFRGNQYTSGCSQNGNEQNKTRGRIGEIIAKELGVGHGTVTRSANFAKGVDAIREVDAALADKILAGKTEITKGEIQSFAKAEPEEVKEAVAEIKEGKRKKYFLPTDRPKKDYSQETLAPQIPSDPNWTPEYGLADLLEEARGITTTFIKQLSRVMRENKTLVENNLSEVSKVFSEVIADIEKLEEEF